MNKTIEKTLESFDQTPIWYRKIGSRNPKLVLNDGIGCDGFIWKYIISHFEKRFGIIHWNYRGHGKSASPNNLDNLGIDACVQDLKTVIKSAAPKAPVVLVGHSMGVQVILEYCHRYPKKVAALIIICGAAGHPINHIHNNSLFLRLFPLLRYATDRLDFIVRDAWQHLIHSEFAYLFANTFEINQNLANREDFEPYLAHLSRMDPIVFLRTLEAASKHTSEPYLEEIELPTLIVGGENDRFTPFWIAEKLHEHMPNSNLLALPEGTHVSPIEYPDTINQQIDKFLDEVILSFK